MQRATAILGLSLTASLLYATQSHAVTFERLRGTIGQVTPTSFVLHTTDGHDVTVALTDQSGFAGIRKSSLADVRPGDFIGTATKGPKGFMVALEVVVFPDSMRGTGEGQYPWDQIPDTTQGPAASSTTSTMTNGTIAATTGAGASKTHSTMTNGTIAASSAGGGAQTLTVTYKDPRTGPGTAKILLPPTAPVVRVEPATRALLTDGAHAFVVATGPADHPTAAKVLIGENGITPPM